MIWIWARALLERWIDKVPGPLFIVTLRKISAEVDTARQARVRKSYPEAHVYQDWRVMLDKEAKNLDTVNVSTPGPAWRMAIPISQSVDTNSSTPLGPV